MSSHESHDIFRQTWDIEVMMITLSDLCLRQKNLSMAAHWDLQVSSSQAFGGKQNGQQRHALEKDLILFLRAFLEMYWRQKFVFFFFF